MGNSAQRDKRDIDRAELRQRVLNLRKQGNSFDAIAKALDLANRSVAWKLYKAALDAIPKEDAELVRKLELEKLLTIERAIFPRAMKGDLAAVDRFLRLQERRDVYTGAALPKKLALTDKDGGDVRPGAPTAAEAARLVREQFGEKAAMKPHAQAAQQSDEGSAAAGVRTRALRPKPSP